MNSDLQILSRHQGTLQPIYVDVCGDYDSYFRVADRFDRFLQSGTAANQDVVTAFKTFLAGGANCHESSLVKLTARNTETLANDLASSIRTAVDGASFYEPWRLFRKAFFELAGNLYATTTSEILEHTMGIGENVWQLNQQLINRISRTTKLLDMLASSVLKEVVIKLGEIPRDSPEYAAIRAQRNELRKIQVLALKLGHTVDPSLQTDTGAVLRDIEKFHAMWKIQKNPLLWAHHVISEAGHYEVVLQKGARIEVKIPMEIPNLTHENPAILFEAIDRVFFFAVRNNISLEISYDPKRGAMVISSPNSLRGLRKDIVIANLVKQLGGTWVTYGSIFSFLFPNPREIIIPLKISAPSDISGPKGGLSLVPSESTIIPGTLSSGSVAGLANVNESSTSSLPIFIPAAVQIFRAANPARIGAFRFINSNPSAMPHIYNGVFFISPIVAGAGAY